MREAAATINAKVQSGAIPRIQALILNAGLREAHGQIWTDEGLDTTFASNYLGHWLLMLLLLQSMNRESGRVVVLGGIVHEQVHSSTSLPSPLLAHIMSRLIVSLSRLIISVEIAATPDL